MNQFVKAVKAIRELGLRKLGYYALYQFGLGTGYYRIVTPNHRAVDPGSPSLAPYETFPMVTAKERTQTLREADEISQDLLRAFGGQPQPLDLHAGASEKHWAVLERQPPEQDLKLIWEPGRFGWAITLARAYAHSGEESYVQDFWEKTHAFLAAHPPNMGRQWQSAQEVAIRLMTLIFCDRVFAKATATKASDRKRLREAIVEHAQRLPHTLIYSRAQNNNHLLSEAAGLYTAGIYLGKHPQAEQWQNTGWRWLNWGFQNQISDTGTYIQHSTNYHRVMLQLALFAEHFRRDANQPDWHPKSKHKLALATRWLWALTDPDTGRTPNLGANDGAYLFPLSSQPFEDYRPVVDAAGKAFLSLDIYNQSELSEMARWFGLTAFQKPKGPQPQCPDMPRLENSSGRGYLHATHFTDRPSHADQLHVDLWWQGSNLAKDPGTYHYNAPPPWANALATASVHNTITIDSQDQMTRAGRFLWLDWAQADILEQRTDQQGNLVSITAQHNGFQRLGILHQRTLTANPNGWSVMDTLLPFNQIDKSAHQAYLTWLLPDWLWSIDAPSELRLQGPNFSFTLTLSREEGINLFRAGVCLLGELEPDPTWGWYSPTYNTKKPALLLLLTVKEMLPFRLESSFTIE